MAVRVGFLACGALRAVRRDVVQKVLSHRALPQNFNVVFLIVRVAGVSIVPLGVQVLVIRRIFSVVRFYAGDSSVEEGGLRGWVIDVDANPRSQSHNWISQFRFYVAGVKFFLTRLFDLKHTRGFNWFRVADFEVCFKLLHFFCYWFVVQNETKLFLEDFVNIYCWSFFVTFYFVIKIAIRLKLKKHNYFLFKVITFIIF